MPLWLLPALGILGAATSLIGGIQAKRQAEQSAADQRREGEMEARQLEAEGFEQVRRDKLANREINSEGLKRAAASDVQVSGSVSAHLKKVKDEQAKELSWLRDSVVSRSDLARRRSGNSARATEARGDSALWQGIGGAATSLGGMIT